MTVAALQLDRERAGAAAIRGMPESGWHKAGWLGASSREAMQSAGDGRILLKLMPQHAAIVSMPE